MRPWEGHTYRACSGQSLSGGPRQWGICRVDNTQPGWRAEDSRTRTRLFASQEAAERAADKLEKQERT